MPVRIATPEETRALFGSGIIIFGGGLRPPLKRNFPEPGSGQKMPIAPMRNQFRTDEAYEEAMVYWHEAAIRITLMAARDKKGSATT